MATKRTRDVKVTIGGPESTPGTAVARTHQITVSTLPTLGRMVAKTPRARLGQSMQSGSVVDSFDVSGDIEAEAEINPGLGKLLNGLLGTGTTAKAAFELGAAIRVIYTGAEDSCLIELANNGSTTQTITSKIGDLGSEAVDNAFGTTGVLDISALDVSTIVSTINAYGSYSASLIAGDGDAVGEDMVVLAGTSASDQLQAKGGYQHIAFGVATADDTKIYAYMFEPTFSTRVPPTYSVQIDGKHKNRLYDGVAVNSIGIDGAQKARLTVRASLLGMGEADDETASSVSQAEATPLRFGEADLYIGSTAVTKAKRFSWSLDNQMYTDGYGTSLDRSYHQPGDPTSEGEIQTAYDTTDTTIYAIRDQVFDGEYFGIHFCAFSPDAITGGSDTAAAGETWKSGIVLSLPYCEPNDYREPDDGGRIDANIPYRLAAPGAQYGSPVRMLLITGEDVDL